MSFNIGDEIYYIGVECERRLGTIMDVSSDMDSYEVMELKNGIPYYASKKLTAAENKRRKAAKASVLTSPIMAPVKPKNMGTVFLEMRDAKSPSKYPEFIPFAEVAEVNG